MTPMARLAGWLGLSEGQAYTSVTGLVVAIALLALGLPAVRDAEAGGAAAAAPRSLALPGSPAVADVIRAPEPEPAAPERGDPAGYERSSIDPGATGRTAAVAGDGAGAGLEATDGRSDQANAGATTPPPTVASDGLTVRDGRYATASAPLLPPGAPGTTFPVALRVGAPDKQSYLRLAGAGTVLRLALSTQPGHHLGTVDAVRACRIVPADWKLEDGSSLATAPEVDQVDCTLGRPGTDAWTFDLAGIDARNGVALLPVGPTTGTFQIVFTVVP